LELVLAGIVHTFISHYLAGKPIAYKISSSFPGDDLDEMWRQVYLDVTSVTPATIQSESFVQSLSSWLVHHQPISLAVNCADFDSSFSLARKLFERTGLVVYTVGSAEKPALTAQVSHMICTASSALCSLIVMYGSFLARISLQL
jgi:hypothetical protein